MIKSIEVNVTTGERTEILMTVQEEIDALARIAVEEAAKPSKDKAAFILQVDTDTDTLIKSVIGERASEYELAEQEATAFKAAGYPATPVPSSVSAWATAKSWTATQATDDIIATALGWRTAQAAIRANRLGLKESARIAADVAALDAVKAQWAGFLSAIRTQLGV